MRIGIDILSEQAGRSTGTETYMKGLLTALARTDSCKHEYFTFVNTDNEGLYRIQHPSFQQVHFPFSNRLRPLRVLSQMLLIPFRARRLGLDVIGFYGTTGAFYVGCATVQHVQTSHHLLVPESVEARSRVFRKLFMGPSARAADLVIVHSESSRQTIIGSLRVPPTRVVVVPLAVDHATFFPERPNDRYRTTLNKYGVEQPYLLFVSSLWPHKNAHGLIEAYAMLSSQGLKSHNLLIVGTLPTDNYQAELHRLVRHHGIEKQVKFLGHVLDPDREEIRDFYVAADVFVYPSYAETFGLPLLEAMACGTPVVASNRTSIPEVAGDAALLVDPDNPEEMAAAIGTLLTDKTKKDEYVARGLHRARDFTWERTAAETLSAYELACRIHAQGPAG